MADPLCVPLDDYSHQAKSVGHAQDHWDDQRVAAKSEASETRLSRAQECCEMNRDTWANVCTLGEPDMFVGDESLNYDCGYDPDPQWISSNELRGVLKSALPIPFAPPSIPRLLNPSTPEQLVLRLQQALTFTPIPSLPRLVRYHNEYLSLQSAASFNLLIQLAIRHTAYGLAKRLLLVMEANRIRSDEETTILFVRLLVRTGDWLRAWRIVRDESTRTGSETSGNLWLELLGRLEHEEFRPRNLRDLGDHSEPNPSAIRPARTEGGRRDEQLSHLEWQSHVTASSLESLLPAKSLPSDRFIYVVVQHLLRNSQTKKACDLTLMWLSRLPRCLGLPQRRRCMKVLHLHLGLSGTGARVHFEGRKLVDKVVKLRPCLRPTSSTLYLLLRSLRHVKKNPTFYALQLVNAFRKRWSDAIIDRRVRRCIVHIAVKEGRMKVAQKWLLAEMRAEDGREILLTARHAFGEEQVKPPTRPRRPPQRQLMPGISLESRQWRWLKRRFWRRASQHHGRLRD